MTDMERRRMLSDGLRKWGDMYLTASPDLRDRVVERMIPMSKAQTPKEAVSEWQFSGYVCDPSDRTGCCDLCEKSAVDLFHVIRKDDGEGTFYCCLDCMRALGRITVARYRSKRGVPAAQRNRELKVAISYNRALKPVSELADKLDDLGERELMMHVDQFIHEYKKRDGLPPRVLIDLMIFMDCYAVAYDPESYNVQLSGAQDLRELLDLDDDSYEMIMPSLSDDQKAWLKRKAEKCPLLPEW
jgi:hypothetical protein